MKVDKERKNVKRTDRHRQNGQTDKERELTHANLGPIGIPFNTSIVRQTETQRHRQTNIDKTDRQTQKESANLGPNGIPFHASIVRQIQTQTNIDTDTQIERE